MKTINLFLSKFLRVSLIFFLFFIWLRFYLQGLWLACVLSAVLTFAVEIILSFVIKNNNIKETLKKEEIANVEGYANYFILNSQKLSVDFFANLLQSEYEVEQKKEYICFEKNDEKCLLFPYFMYKKFSIEDLIVIFNKTKKTNATKILICTNEIEGNVLGFIENLPMTFCIFDKFEVYEKLMKKFNVYPEKCLNLKTESKLTFRKFLEISLNKKRSKGYIFASYILLFSSLFVKVNIYYLIMSSILLLLSIFSHTNHIFNKKKDSSMF